MTRKKVIIGVIVLVVLGAIVYANVAFKKDKGTAVTVEPVSKRNLEAVVSASGTIRAKRTVNITSEVTGKITRLAVDEGNHVKAGQFLLEIDSRIPRSRVEGLIAQVEQAKIGQQQAKVALESANESLKLSQDESKRQQDLLKAGIGTRQDYERADTDLKVKQNNQRNAAQQVSSADQAIRQMTTQLESAQHELSKVTINAPIDGIITKRNVEEGETAMQGFTNNPSVVLLVLADMSIIEAEIQVDETDIPNVKVGQPAKVTIDALPDRTFKAHVTEVGNSPISTTTVSSARQATNFKVVVTLDETIPDVRPGFSCTADITTATRTDVASVPIQAMTVRELVYDSAGNVVKPPANANGRAKKPAVTQTSATQELKPGQTRKETEGVYLFRDGKTEFVPVKTGIAGDKYFEVLSGLKLGDQVITGPFASVRNLREGAAVVIDKNATSAAAEKK